MTSEPYAQEGPWDDVLGEYLWNTGCPVCGGAGINLSRASKDKFLRDHAERCYGRPADFGREEQE